MRNYLLDTDTCVFFLRNKYGIVKKIDSIGIERCSISEVTLAELIYGAYKSSAVEKHLMEVKELQELFEVVPIFGSLHDYSQERLRLEKLGKRLPDFDLLIATTALTHDLIMVTNNETHLGRVEGIQIENWTKASFNEFAAGK